MNIHIKNLTRAQLPQQHSNGLPGHPQELLAEHEGKHRSSLTSEEVMYINNIDMDEVEHQHQQVQDAQLHPVHPDQHQEVVSIDLAQDHLPQHQQSQDDLGHLHGHQQTDSEQHHQEVQTTHQEQCHQHRHQAVQLDQLQPHHSEVEHLAQHHRVQSRDLQHQHQGVQTDIAQHPADHLRQLHQNNVDNIQQNIMMHIRQINRRGIYNILGFHFIIGQVLTNIILNILIQTIEVWNNNLHRNIAIRSCIKYCFIFLLLFPLLPAALAHQQPHDLLSSHLAPQAVCAHLPSNLQHQDLIDLHVFGEEHLHRHLSTANECQGFIVSTYVITAESLYISWPFRFTLNIFCVNIIHLGAL